jgi:hypothetical protein
MQAYSDFFERLLGLIALGFDARKMLAQIRSELSAAWIMASNVWV